jgi:hypothetical protein
MSYTIACMELCIKPGKHSAYFGDTAICLQIHYDDEEGRTELWGMLFMGEATR